MCAHAVRVAVRKIPGVDSVGVSLNRGIAVIRFKPDNRVAVERVREAIRSNGFTPKAAEVRVAGKIVERGDRLALATPGQDVAYLLADHPEAPGKAGDLARLKGDEVVVEGTVPETKRGATGPPTLEVRAFSNPRRPGG